MLQDNPCHTNVSHPLIALGANVASDSGGPEDSIRLALSLLAEAGVKPNVVSRLFRSPSFPAGSGPDFVNAAAALMCELPPTETLSLLHEIEERLGRVRRGRWGPRVIDLDLLACGDAILPDKQSFDEWADLSLEQQTQIAPDRLILPHPRIQDRAFVLIPLADIAPEWKHPVLRQTVREMIENLPMRDRDQIIPL